ncbi:MAG: acyl-[acyl-carrier-protein] thioesterase [Clostridium sp.]|nr:acyl-[acyl-carrier-protein] thioesterase [Clostridium sp.]
MYSFDSRVRFSETEEDGSLSVRAMMNYLQDCSGFQSEDAGVGVRYLSGIHRAWFLYSWNIVIDRMPVLGERIRISTWPFRFRGVFGYRNFTISDEQGNYLVRAESVWFFVNTDTGAPEKAPEEETLPYGPMGERLDMPESPRKIRVPDLGEDMDPVTVMLHHLDTNHHVNNAQYVEMARECLPEEFRIFRICAEYRRAAVLGDVIFPRAARTCDGYIVSLRSDTGEVFANIMLTGH